MGRPRKNRDVEPVATDVSAPDTVSSEPISQPVEDGFTVASTRERKPRGIKLRIFNGSIDWASTGEKQSEAMEALRNDPSLRSAIQASTPTANLIEEKHVDYFLDMIEFAEQFFLPRMLARKPVPEPLKPYFPTGKFVIDARVAKAALTFSDKKRAELLPLGVEAGNRHLPEKVKKLISKVGPGSEFGYKLLMAVRDQQVNLIQMQIAFQVQNSRRDAVPQRSNGVDHSAVVEAPPKSETNQEQSL